MARAFAYAQAAADIPAEIARKAIVVSCALALIAAGQVLPSF